MNFSLRNPILATIVYYDVFEYPLTLFEVYKYLVNPGRIYRITAGLGDIKMSEIAVELDRLVGSGIIGHKNGFYLLNKKEDLYDLRMERHKIAELKWKKFLKITKFLSLAPYLRGVFASGSMALNNTDENSDFDVLIITASGRLYTCRFFLWLISSFIGARRKKHEKTAPDKLCFNHYLTDFSLYIPHESIFNAQTYINLIPVMISDDLVDKFFSANLWLNNYVYNFHPQKEFTRRKVVVPLPFKLIPRVGALILNSFFGDWIEYKLKNYQQRRIKKDPATYASGGRVVFNDSELEFHPYSFETVVVEKYNDRLRSLGIVPYIKETDSGLN